MKKRNLAKMLLASTTAGILINSCMAMAASNGPLFIPSAQVDLAHMTVTLPYYEGKLSSGAKFLFIITDASTEAVAKQLGVANSPILAAASSLSTTRKISLNTKGISTFDHGTIDFTPERVVVPGDAPNFFPPKQALPGSVGSNDYNPLAQMADGTIINAPIIATVNAANEMVKRDGSIDYTKTHDKVLAVDQVNCTVTLQLTPGFTSGQRVVYLSFDANVPLAAALEAATLTAADNQLLNSGTDLNLFALANGQTGSSNLQHQGFNSALSGDGSPLNILTLSASSTSYSPIWNVNVGAWSAAAVASGANHRLMSSAEVKAAAQAGLITSPDGKPLGSAGIIVNCPVVQVLAN